MACNFGGGSPGLAPCADITVPRSGVAARRQGYTGLPSASRSSRTASAAAKKSSIRGTVLCGRQIGVVTQQRRWRRTERRRRTVPRRRPSTCAKRRLDEGAGNLRRRRRESGAAPLKTVGSTRPFSASAALQAIPLAHTQSSARSVLRRRRGRLQKDGRQPVGSGGPFGARTPRAGAPCSARETSGSVGQHDKRTPLPVETEPAGRMSARSSRVAAARPVGRPARKAAIRPETAAVPDEGHGDLRRGRPAPFAEAPRDGSRLQAVSNSNPTMLRSSRPNSIPIRWTGTPGRRYLSA